MFNLVVSLVIRIQIILISSMADKVTKIVLLQIFVIITYRIVFRYIIFTQVLKDSKLKKSHKTVEIKFFLIFLREGSDSVPYRNEGNLGNVDCHR
jgi:hypothetical protein